jgi:hemerythrin
MYKWTNSLTVGVPAFDKAHQQLFSYFDEFHTAMLEGKSKDQISSILDRTQAYTKQHFDSEEKWLAGKSDPDLINHKAQHRKFQEQIVTFIKENNAGKIGLSGVISKTLREWLGGHIMEIDQQYAKRYNTNSKPV